MFYARINKLKIVDNREGFWGLFDARCPTLDFPKNRISSVEKSPPPRTRTPPLPDYPAKAAKQSGKREAKHGVVYVYKFIYFILLGYGASFTHQKWWLTLKSPVVAAQPWLMNRTT